MALLDGKVAFITGVARGLGRSHAVRLAEEGADIIGLDICADIDSLPYSLSRPEDLQETAQMVEALDRRVHLAQADVRDLTAVQKVAAEGVAALGPIDIVVANAGVGTSAPAWELTEDEWQSHIDVILTGTWKTIKATVPGMIERGNGGSIVLIGSYAGLRGMTNVAHYAVAKAGVVQLTRVLANELGEHNIRVNCVCPGSTRTPLSASYLPYILPDMEDPTWDDANHIFGAFTTLPNAWLDPVDQSNAVLWLASEQARYVTGVIIPVDAGWANKTP